MANLAIGIFLILFAVLGLLSTKIPDFILPLAAGIAGLVVLFGSWKRGP
jgi:hypothetical protein